MVVVVKYPINVHIDNAGDILLSENTLVSRRVKHIDVHYHLIWYYFEDRAVKIKLVCSEENIAYTFTNNQSNELFHSLT